MPSSGWLTACILRHPSTDRARQTLSKHASDPRPWTYSLRTFAEASTHDPLWNAAQRQLLAEGTLHNAGRMHWGKKILHWSSSPLEALEAMIELNNRYALDGRDPNSYTGIFWCLGQFDRPFWPERPNRRGEDNEPLLRGLIWSWALRFENRYVQQQAFLHPFPDELEPDGCPQGRRPLRP